MIFKKSRLESLSNLEFSFITVLWSNLKETLTQQKLAFSVRTVLKFFFFGYKNKRSKYEVKV